MLPGNGQTENSTSPKPRVVLLFTGSGKDLRLDELTFFNHLGSRTTRLETLAEAGQPSFQWSSVVRGMCLLLVLTGRRAIDSSAPDCELIGKKGSQARSLDDAISQGSRLAWLRDMFGTRADDSTVAKLLFERRNSGQKLASQPVRVAVCRNYLPYDNVEIVRDGKKLTDPSDFIRLTRTGHPLRLRSIQIVICRVLSQRTRRTHVSGHLSKYMGR